MRLACADQVNRALRRTALLGIPASTLLAALLERTGCDPNLIGIEITETVILPDVEAAAREITTARRLGIKVALDDFGTGHSSLTLLRSLPIDKVKIDQTFVRELGCHHAQGYLWARAMPFDALVARLHERSTDAALPEHAKAAEPV